MCHSANIASVKYKEVNQLDRRCWKQRSLLIEYYPLMCTIKSLDKRSSTCEYIWKENKMINSKYVVLDTDMILTDIKFFKLKKFTRW